jgi:hypothetical protein
VKAHKACFEADFVAGVFEDDFSALVSFISVVQFGDGTNDPESLPVQLLFEIGVKKFFQVHFVAD